MTRYFKITGWGILLTAILITQSVWSEGRLSHYSFPESAVIFLPSDHQVEMLKDDPNMALDWLDSRLLLTFSIDSTEPATSAFPVSFQLKDNVGAIIPVKVWNETSQEYKDTLSAPVAQGITVSLLTAPTALVALTQVLPIDQPQMFALEILGLNNEPIQVANVAIVKLAEESEVDHE